MTASVVSRVMDALAAALENTPGVDTLITDFARVVSRPDGVALSIDIDGSADDQISKTCEIDTTLPVLVTLFVPREPDGPPNWQLLDPVYVELHQRIMADRRLGGLALDIVSTGRVYEQDIKVCSVGCRYSVKYRTRQEDVTT